LSGVRFHVGSPLFGSGEVANAAQFGTDLLVDSPDLGATMETNGFAYLSTSDPAAWLDSRGFNGANKTDAIPVVCYLFATPADLAVGSEGADVAKCGFEFYMCSTLTYALDTQSVAKSVKITGSYTLAEVVSLTSHTPRVEGAADATQLAISA
jgi:hypothetical protein